MNYIDFWYQDIQTGEDFFVEVENDADARFKADRIAKQNFPNPRLVNAVSPLTADVMGFDTY